MPADLARLLGMEVVMANDANCFALAETRLGVVKQQFPEAEVVFGIILGTGVGGGVVVDGRVLAGYHGLAGEWGHNQLSDTEGAPCFCGKAGCNESTLAGPVLERYYAAHSGQALGLREIASRAQAGTDAVAAQTMHRLTAFFGLALSRVVNVLDLDVIVIGGVGNIDCLSEAGVASVAPHVFDHQFAAPLLSRCLATAPACSARPSWWLSALGK